MGERDAAAREVGEHRLDVGGTRAARRRIAVVADRERPFEVHDPVGVLGAEDVADETDMAFRDELPVVVGDDP